jgi:hypothetical protein
MSLRDHPGLVARFMRVAKDDPALRQSQQTVGQLAQSEFESIARRHKVCAGFFGGQTAFAASEKPGGFWRCEILIQTRGRRLLQEIFKQIERKSICALPMLSLIF